MSGLVLGRDTDQPERVHVAYHEISGGNARVVYRSCDDGFILNSFQAAVLESLQFDGIPYSQRS